MKNYFISWNLIFSHEILFHEKLFFGFDEILFHEKLFFGFGEILFHEN